VTLTEGIEYRGEEPEKSHTCRKEEEQKRRDQIQSWESPSQNLNTNCSNMKSESLFQFLQWFKPNYFWTRIQFREGLMSQSTLFYKREQT